MKKLFKKSLAVLWSLVMLVCYLPLIASAETYSGTCGSDLTWSLDINTGVLTITGTGKMRDYQNDDYNSASRPSWYSLRMYLESVEIGDGVTRIGACAFLGCTYLESVSIPDSVTEIGTSAFEDCHSLASVSIPDSVSWVWTYAFRYCHNLTSVQLPANVVLAPGAFYNCNRLESVTIPVGCSILGKDVFKYCFNLKSITVDENHESYSNDDCGVLFSKDKTTLIQYPIGAERTNYTIPDTVTAIGDSAFYESENLKSITIPDSVVSIGESAFGNCDNLKSVTIPDSVITISSSAFSGCANLTGVTIGKGVTTIASGAFSGCGSLISFGVDSDNLYYSSDDYGVLFNKDKTELLKYPIGNKRINYVIPDSVTNIGEGAFSGCDSFISMTIPDSVITISSSAFSGCDNLADITIGNGIMTIGRYAFASCPSITSITIPSCVAIIEDGAFYNCDNLTSVIIIYGRLSEIGDDVVWGCDSLKDIYYTGTWEQWCQIQKGDGNYFDRKTMHYNYDPSHNHYYTYSVTSWATCTQSGKMLYTCDCGFKYSEVIPAKGHKAGEWEITLKPTTEADGKGVKKCTVCRTQLEEIVIGKITEPEVNEAVVSTPSQNTINYGDSIVLHINAELIPEGGYVEWTASSGNFAYRVSEDGSTCTITPSASGETTFTATVYDEFDRPVLTDEQVMTAKAGFFQKIIAFFKKLFGLSKVILQSV